MEDTIWDPLPQRLRHGVGRRSIANVAGFSPDTNAYTICSMVNQIGANKLFVLCLINGTLKMHAAFLCFHRCRSEGQQPSHVLSTKTAPLYYTVYHAWLNMFYACGYEKWAAQWFLYKNYIKPRVRCMTMQTENTTVKMNCLASFHKLSHLYLGYLVVFKMVTFTYFLILYSYR